MKKIISNVLIFCLLFGQSLIPLSSKAISIDWDVTGSYVFSFDYQSSQYPHNVSLTQNEMGQVTGNGEYAPYTWVITNGAVVGNSINLTANYTATSDAVEPQTVMNITGTIANDGSMSGTWTDNYQGGERAGTWMTTSGNANEIEMAPTSVKVTIVKYINGEEANTTNTNNTSFPMTATWNTTNIGSGTGNYNLSATGYNNPNPYRATTSDMNVGADYSTYENTGSSCIPPIMYALAGYTTGNTLEEAKMATPSLTVPELTNLQSDKFIIVWNKTCVSTPVHLTPADNSVRTTAEQTLIDWSDVTNWASPITYMYQSALSMATNMDGAFTSPAYTSGALTNSEIPTPGTPEGIYYWHVKATDTVGNTSGWTVPWKITINNTGTLTVNKNVLKPDGVTEVSDNQTFSVMLNGSNNQSVSENTSHTYTNLTPGIYTVTEGENSNYEFVSFSNDSDTETAGAQVEVVANQNTIVTITNKQKPATLTINKIVTNPNGSTAVATDFAFQINEGETINFIDSEDENTLTGQNVISVDPGTYTITEVLPMGAYAISYSENCTNAVLASNGSATCTITNSDIPAGKGAITVRKIVNNMYAGELGKDDFDLFINSEIEENNLGEVVRDQSNFLNPGTYTISESILPSGYMQTSLVCSSNGDSDDTDGTITITEQDSWVCTITNNDKPAKLTIIKKIINNAWNADLTETFNFNLTGQEDISVVTEVPEGEYNSEEYDAIGQSNTMNISAGEYNLTEDLLSQWNLTNVSCSGEEGSEIENGVALSLSNGEEVTCTFTNTRKTGTLVVNKLVKNDNSGEKNVSDFSFKINDGEPISFNDTEDGNNLTGQNTIILETGTYYISEPEFSGYDRILENNCRTTVLNEGETMICDIVNNDLEPNSSGLSSVSGGGSVLGASTENTETTTNEEKKEEPKTEGKVLGDTTCTPYLTSFMKFGAKNDKEQVKLLQAFLNENLGLSLKVDGVYGISTKNAVIKFQEKYKADILDPWIPFGLKDGKGTGAVYKTTLWKVNSLKCEGVELPKPQLP